MIVCTSDEISSRRQYIENLFFMDFDKEIIEQEDLASLRKVRKIVNECEGDKNIFILGVRSDNALLQINGYTSPTKYIDDRIYEIEQLNLADLSVYIDNINCFNDVRNIMPDHYISRKKQIDIEKFIVSYGGKIINI